jgi:hypothetical protein
MLIYSASGLGEEKREPGEPIRRNVSRELFVVASSPLAFFIIR